MDSLIIIIYIFFSYGVISYFRYRFLLFIYLKKLSATKTNIIHDNTLLPFIGILVPARNEGYVIENTVRRLSKLNYPKDRYAVFIIVDERELNDDVEILTKTAVFRAARKIRRQNTHNFIYIIQVPEWYSGIYKNHDKTYKRSTKGRALNYALQVLNSKRDWDRIEMIGVLDADGRLDIQSLQEVAYNRIHNGSVLLQGPVFQISNIQNISITGIAAGLELAIYHMTELASKLLRNKVQFLAGTNYFIDKHILETIGGWNQDSLVEDADLALRIYVELGEKAEWLNSTELEQSPGTLAVYLKQRERWSRGHLYLMSDIIKARLSYIDKWRFIKRIIISQGRFIIDIIIPITALVILIRGDLDLINRNLKWVSLFFFFASLLIFDLYGYMLRKISRTSAMDMTKKQKLLLSIKLFLFMPFFAIIQIIPRVKAAINYLTTNNVTWYKTERTKELITE